MGAFPKNGVVSKDDCGCPPCPDCKYRAPCNGCDSHADNRAHHENCPVCAGDVVFEKFTWYYTQKGDDGRPRLDGSGQPMKDENKILQLPMLSLMGKDCRNPKKKAYIAKMAEQVKF